MKSHLATALLLTLVLSIRAEPAADWEAKKAANEVAALTPEEECAKVGNRNGRIFLTNPYGRDELLNSPDILFLAAATALWKQTTPLIARSKSGEAFKAIEAPGERATVAARWTQGLALLWGGKLALRAGGFGGAQPRLAFADRPPQPRVDARPAESERTHGPVAGELGKHPAEALAPGLRTRSRGGRPVGQEG